MPDLDFRMSFDFHGIDLSPGDFRTETLRGWVAYSIASALNVHCRDRAAALELLDAKAAEIIQAVAETALEQFRRNLERHRREKEGG